MKERKNWLLTTMITLLLILSMIPLITNTVSAAAGLGDYDTSGICGEKVYVEANNLLILFQDIKIIINK